MIPISLTFDVDAEAGWLGEGDEYARRLTILSEGRYGVVRGVPRILELLARHDIPATFFVPGYTAEHHPGLVDTLLEAGHEIAHHGYVHLRSDKVSAAEQAGEIEKGLEAFDRLSVPKPKGYRSTSWELTPETFELLVQYNFAYDSSCMGDDRPYVERWGDLEILEIPVHWSLDDWPRFGWNIDGGGNVADPAEMRRAWIAEFESARTEQRHTSFTMHPEVIGRPYRLAELERVIEHIAGSGDAEFVRFDTVAERAAAALRLSA